MVRLVYEAVAPKERDLDEEALAWVVRLTSGASTPADHETFRRWRDETPEHAQALARARTLWTKLGTAIPEVERREARRVSSRSLRRAAVAAPIAASLILSLGCGFEYWRVWRFDVVTAVGQRRTIALPDGSRALLAGDTAINLDYRRGVRRLELARGEAMFQVRHDALHPFVVHAGAAEIRDVGTVFDVARTRDGAKVVVSSGVVEASSEDQRAILIANQAVSISPGQLGSIRAVDASADTAWTRGWLIMDDKPLSEILSALRPYSSNRILLVNPEAGRQRLSATIDLDHIDTWIDALSRTRTVRLTRLGNLIILR